MNALNEKKATVVVAMSGGVDSSVAAALLLERGFTVIGVTMKTYAFDEVGGNPGNDTSCCGLDAFNDARMVAVKLGIPHYVVDFTRQFEREVIDNFVDEYLKGRTPNPCIICNRTIKWGELLAKANSLGADYIATGHYARIGFDPESRRYFLARARDRDKDQSYALWSLSQEALSRTMFPLGEITKREVRTLAVKYGLKTAFKEESYEICFVADNNYRRFLTERIPDLQERIPQGEIVWDGKVVGRHDGYPFYTLGQRSGIGAFGERVYVTGIDPDSNTLTIGRASQLMNRGLIASKLNLVSHAQLPDEMRVEAAVRYKDDPTPATVSSIAGDSIRVLFDHPKRAITPGQSVVLYRGDLVIAGGVIDEVIS